MDALLEKLFHRARSSRWALWFLNVVLLVTVPFNNPHKIKILNLTKESILVRLPFKQTNLNHVKTLHACAIATLAEYASGVLLLSRLNVTNYQMLITELKVSYHTRGRTAATASFSLTQDWLKTNVTSPLESDGVALVDAMVEVYDEQQNHLASAAITWHIKELNKTSNSS